jgi:ParB/RepB/Spo0J family partition protein
MDAKVTPPDFSEMCREIEAAGQRAMHPVGELDDEKRTVLFAHAVEEVRGLRADAIKWKRYFKRRQEPRFKAWQVRQRAERRLGQLLIAMKDAGILTDGRSTPGFKIGTLPKEVLTLEQLGLGKDESRAWQALARISDQEFEAWLDKPRTRRTTAARRSSRAGPQIQCIALSIITVSNRVRALRPEAVDAMAESMRDQGLLNPITVRPEGNGYKLVIGHHRCAAARKLGWEKIDCIIRKGLDAITAELCEIDENLIRADLTPAEQAAHHARRKELYEEKHPETKKGAAGRGRKKSQIATSNEPAPAFVDDTAQKTGKHRSTVARAVKRGKDIPNIAELAGTALDEGAELDALAKLKEIAPERQADLIEKAKAGERVSAKAEIQARRKGRTPPAVTDAPHDSISLFCRPSPRWCQNLRPSPLAKSRCPPRLML